MGSEDRKSQHHGIRSFSLKRLRSQNVSTARLHVPTVVINEKWQTEVIESGKTRTFQVAGSPHISTINLNVHSGWNRSVNFIEHAAAMPIGSYLMVYVDDEPIAEGYLVAVGEDFVDLRYFDGTVITIALDKVTGVANVSQETLEKKKKRYDMDTVQMDLDERKYQETLPYSTTSKRQAWER